MNYDFTFGSLMSMKDQIQEIIDISDKLDANESATIFEFGQNRDLVLHIDKDSEYHRDIDENLYNLVRVHTAQNGSWVDDTEDIYVTDGALYKELVRIWNYRDYGTL